MTKVFDVFLYFDGDCREALEFYAQVFDLPVPEEIMTYGEAPGISVSEENRDRIIYTSLPIYGISVMMSDYPAGSNYVKGTNISLSLGTDDADEIKRLYAALSDGGSINMELGQTFFNDLYAMVTDRFGITWQFGLAPAEA